MFNMAYETYLDKLNHPQTTTNDHVAILVEAYCEFHNQSATKTIRTVIQQMYNSFYSDPYFFLKLTYETMDLKIKGDRLQYIKNVGDKRLGRI